MIAIHGHADIGDDIRDRWLDLTRPGLAASRSAPGNLLYLYASDLFEPSSFHVWQLWEDQAAIDAHIADPEHKARLRDLDELGGRWTSVTHYEISEVRKKR
jgi:quinol monooxygenase YgiN